MHVGKTDFEHDGEQTQRRQRRDEERREEEMMRFVSFSCLPKVVLVSTSLAVEAK